jgi:hypothetical protein
MWGMEGFKCRRGRGIEEGRMKELTEVLIALKLVTVTVTVTVVLFILNQGDDSTEVGDRDCDCDCCFIHPESGR